MYQEVSDFFNRNDIGKEDVERLKSKMHNVQPSPTARGETL